MEYPVKILIIIVTLLIAFIIILGLITSWSLDIGEMVTKLKDFFDKLYSRGIGPA